MRRKKTMAWYWILLTILSGLWVLTLVIYWFNLDNKLLFYVVRPMLNRLYDKKQRTKSLK